MSPTRCAPPHTALALIALCVAGCASTPGDDQDAGPLGPEAGLARDAALTDGAPDALDGGAELDASALLDSGSERVDAGPG